MLTIVLQQASMFEEENCEDTKLRRISVPLLSYSSPAACKEIMTAYDIIADIPRRELIHRIGKFLSDAVFSFPVYRARNSFVNRHPKIPNSVVQGNHLEDTTMVPYSDNPLHTGIHSYRIKFGNPFPGEQFNVAQHCVELIYLFDAFHEDLERADHHLCIHDE